MQYMATTYGKTIDHSYDWLGQGTYGLVQIQHVEPRNAIRPHISTSAFVVLVTPRTESFVALSCEDDHANFWPLSTNLDSIQHLKVSLRTKGITHLLSANGYFGNPLKKLKPYILIFFYLGPISIHIFYFL